MAFTEGQIGDFYKQYLGRDVRPGEAQGWMGNDAAESMISGSGEGQAFKKSGTSGAGGGWSGVPQTPQAGAMGPGIASPQQGGGFGGPGVASPQGQGFQSSTNEWVMPGDARLKQGGAASPGGGGFGGPGVAAPTPPGGIQDKGNYTPAQIAANKLAGMDIGPGTYNRDVLAQAFQQKQFGGNPNINVADFLKSLGGLASGVTQISPDKIRLPDGEVIDVARDVSAGGLGGAWWGSEKDWQADEAAGKHAGGGGAAGGGGGGGGAAGGAAGGGGGGFAYGNSGQRDQLFNTLLDRSKQTLNIGSGDANIRAQADPYAANIERERRRFIGDTAERMGPLANIQGEERLSSEKAGQASGLFESQLIGREMEARRNEIAQALASMQGMLSQEQQLAMQKELANLDASIRNRQISSSNEQFMSQLGLQSENQNNYWDAIRSGLLNG